MHLFSHVFKKLPLRNKYYFEFQHQHIWGSQLGLSSSTHDVMDGKDSVQGCTPPKPRRPLPLSTAAIFGKGDNQHWHKEANTENALKTQKYWYLEKKSLFIFKILNSQNSWYEDGQREFLPLCETYAHILAHAHFWIWIPHGIVHRKLHPMPVETNVSQ